MSENDRDYWSEVIGRGEETGNEEARNNQRLLTVYKGAIEDIRHYGARKHKHCIWIF